MYPLQFSGLFGGGSSLLLIGGIVFVIVLAVIIGYLYLRYRAQSDPWEAFADACYEIVEAEDADAIALIPYSDGPMLPKPAIYDQELMGGKGGYRTSDGEIIYVDGQGTGRFDLEGVPLITAIDPTEHASAVDPLKAYMAYEENAGRWLKLDREGTLIEAGEALASVDDVEPAMDQPKGATAADGGHPSMVHEHAVDEGMTLADAKRELEQAGLLTKVVDLAPPREAVVDEDTGEVRIEEADHVAVDFSYGADMLPKKTNTTELQVMEEKARNEARDDEKFKEYAVTFALVGGLIGGGIGIVMGLLFLFA